MFTSLAKMTSTLFCVVFAGFIKFLEPYYMILVTKRRLVGNICGHAIYGIGERLLLTVPHSSVLTDLTFSKAESRLA